MALTRARSPAEFGGAPGLVHRASRLVEYFRQLQTVNIKQAYFFKLRGFEEEPEVAHPYSWLLDTHGTPSPGYEIMKRLTP